MAVSRLVAIAAATLTVEGVLVVVDVPNKQNLPSLLALESNRPCCSKGGAVKYDKSGGDAGLSVEGSDDSFLIRLRLVGVCGMSVSVLGRLDDGGGEGYIAELATMSGQ